MTNRIRKLVFDKYNGHCAYCGCELQKGWHIDHLQPIVRKHEYDKNAKAFKVIGMNNPQNDNIDNYMPACASCNINKHSLDLEEFRQLIQGFVISLNKRIVQYKVAKRYGLIQENPKAVVFYFETFKATTA